MATGILAGRHCQSPVTAAIAGVAMHGLMDIAPHGEINDSAWEKASIFAAIPVLGMSVGWTSPILWGAIGGFLPDVEHALPFDVPGAGSWYPTHRYDLLHSSDKPLNMPAWMQVALGGLVLGWFIARGRTR